MLLSLLVKYRSLNILNVHIVKGSDHCYKNSLNFKELVNKEHSRYFIKVLKNEQIEDIIYDLKRVRFNCPDCLEDEDEKEILLFL